MFTALKKIWRQILDDESLALQVRLHRLMCLSVGFLCLLVVLPANLFQNLPQFVNIADIVLGLFALFCYRESCHGRNHTILFFTIMILLLDSVWYLNAGSHGSITYYFFPAMLYPMAVFRSRVWWVAIALVLLNICTLLAVEHLVPSLTVPFKAQSDRLIDLTSGVICAGIALSLIVWVILKNYEWERSRISRYARELALSEKNYREVVENAKSIILRLDSHGSIKFLNKFAEELFNYRREEIIGKAAVGTILPEMSLKGEEIGAFVRQFLKHPGQHAQSELECLCRDGRRIRVNWTHQPIYDEHGRLSEMLCVGADVTEHAALVERLQLTQRTMDAAADQIVWTDNQARIIYANTAASETLSYTAGEIRSLNLHEISTDFPASAWECHWEKLKRDRSITFEMMQRCKDGSSLPVEVTTTYMNVHGREYTTAFMRDITERKLAEQKRLLLEQQMQHMQRLESLGMLAGGIAHDFNNLLTAIIGNISVVKPVLPAGGDEHEAIREAEKASNQAKNLTAQLLTFSKGGKPVKEVIALEPVIRDSASLALRGSAVKCQIQIPHDLWPMEADASQLVQVFQNILLNAKQAMTGSGQITIQGCNLTGNPSEGELFQDGRYVQIKIQDEGTGIEEKNLSRIFDPYFTTKKTGSGLGLAVVHSIVQNHRGQISVQSKPGEGSTFTLLLPASDRPLTVRPVVASRHATSPSRILVMDDEEMVRKLLTILLKRMGYESECVADGSAALKAYQTAMTEARPFDAVIMDLTIPGGMGGRETIQRLREIDPNVTAIVSSGYSDDPVMADHRAYGFRGVMMKPYTADQLSAAIQSVLPP